MSDTSKRSKRFTSWKCLYLCLAACDGCLDKMNKAVTDCREAYEFSFPSYGKEECDLLETNMKELCAIKCGGEFFNYYNFWTKGRGFPKKLGLKCEF